ncbi:SDR family NAD(P)-dependent oxidoreductase [Streptomyces sp. A1499]|uniref:SDR family NAD(P)-dependent oxidoreductase n=1 Tax=Streptomyces sp. A1499 TaxID=2563104 RepID=UPI00109E434A|nr:SDR family NAD(P)-dependent oxidoreductase [Streptomyces sp. A1499]THC51890.1 SDR family NAD(P)-dependent oxidoreductase [Streptomyces sp. A1499]
MSSHDATEVSGNDIAIVGMAGRFPGADSVGQFWELLRAGREGITRFGDEELAAAGVPEALRADPAYVRAHGILPDVDLFDTGFFEFTPAEAEVIDPQQRLFLQSCHTALEDAGYDPRRYDGLISVYGGAAINTYLQRHVLPSVDQTATSDHFKVMVGNDKDFLATRVSYKLDLRGPSYSVQTACSTSLVAIHLACQGLINGECDMALAGGVTVKLPQVRGYLYEEGAILSSDGRVRTFDADAGGTVLGNGVGIVVLKLLEDALDAGDTVHAVIKGTATNNDGSLKVSYAAPGKEGQAAVITEAHAVSGTDPGSVSYVEAHGTATRLGDPVEVSALTDAFRRGTPDTGFCAIGSLKSNVGHLDAAAGVAGVIKTALMLRHRSLVPTLHYERPNPAIDFAATPFYVNTETRPWEGEGPLRAGVSSFGIGGTNAHAILQEAPGQGPSEPSPREEQLLVLSAKTPTALDTLTDALADHFEADPGADIADAAYTLAMGRQAHRHRRAVICAGPAEAVRALRAARAEPGRATGEAPAADGQRPFTPDPQLAGRALLDAVRTAWLDGAEVDWAGFYAGERRRRVPLPTYPFEGRRVWLEPPPEPAAAAPAEGPHPLLGANVSTLAEHRYATTLTGEEFFIADHRVEGRAIMPAVAYLEMARAAGALSLPPGTRAVARVSFERPLSFGHGPRTVHVELTPHGDAARFAITDRTTTATGEPEVFARGELSARAPADAPAPADPAAIGERCPDLLAAADLYDLLRTRGLDYGPAMRSLRELRRGGDEALAVLELPAGAFPAGERASDAFVLHPSLLDAALHAVVGLLAAREDDGTTYLPLALGGLEVLRPLPRHCLAHVTLPAHGAGEKQTKADVDLLDTEGRLLARLRDLSVRTRRHGHDEPGTALFAGVWETTAAEAPAAPPAGPRLLLAHDPALREALRGADDAGPAVVLATPGEEFTQVDDDHYTVDPYRQEDFAALLDRLAETGRTPSAVLHTWCAAEDTHDHDGARSVFALTKALLARRGSDRTALLVAHRTDAHGARPAEAALAGFARSATLENPRLTHRLVGLDAATPLLPTLAGELARLDDGETETRHSGGVRRVRRRRRLTEVAAGTVAGTGDASTPPAGGGACLITGGAGSLGLTLAEHLAARTGAPLVLLGRSAPAPAAVRRVEALRAAGHDVTLRQADVTDEAALREAVGSVRAEHGAIRGIVHAAGTLDDAYLLHKSWEEFTGVVGPKALGARLLDRLTADDPLDFFVCFSSIAAAFGNAGQSDYAYANAYLDAFAERRRARVAAGSRSGRTLSLGWPLWSAGGMRQDEDAVRALRRRTGLSPMPTDAGLAAFDRALRQDGGALLVGHGDLARVAAALEPAPVPKPVAAGGAADAGPSGTDPTEWAAGFLRRLLAERTKLDAREIDPRVPFDRYGIDSLVITQLNAELERHFDDLPKTLFFEYATLEELAEYFAAEYAERLGELAATDDGSADGGPAGGAAAPATDASADPPETKPALTARTTGPATHRPGPAADDSHAVAVIGLAGRYPLADDVDEFWDNLAEGRDCVTEIPADRWDHDRYFDADPSAPGRAFSKWGGFLRDVDRFDPLFFGISPREAELMDPQERLFLQNAWHVFEDAGYRRDELSGRPVGVFVGVMYGEYQLYGAADAERGGIRVTGSSFASIANRVSYTLGLNGPSIALDTMCSSSLTAIHLACESLRGGESEVAVAGGVNLSLHPYKYVFLSQGRFVSADGRCRAFGAGGTGYVPGEGVGAVLLKPLAAAERDGDHIYGVIRGHAVNHGGRTNGYTVPSPHAQADSVRRALGVAGLEPADIGYVEAHGTGTSLGDPIEIAGLAKAFGASRADGPRWPIGSVKSNIGHLESAAGIAGLTKVLLQFKHRRLAPSLHADELNPNIDFGRSPFHVQREAADWPAPVGEHGTAPRRAGLSSFGAGGSNAHLVVEEYREGPERPERPVARQRFARPLVFPLSARDTERLGVYAGRLADFAEREAVRAEDLAHTLQHGREVMDERLAVVADDGAALVRALRAFQQGSPCPGLVTGASSGSGRPAEDGGAFDVAARWTRDGSADWSAIASGGPKPRRVPAPRYPFARERYWVPAADRGDSGTPARLHPLLDANESTVDEIRFRRAFRAGEPLVRDHVIEGRALLAGTVCLEMARAAAGLAGLDDALGLRDVLWGRPVVIEDGQSVDVYVGLARTGGGPDRASRELAFTVWTSQGTERTVHVRGTVYTSPAGPVEAGPTDLAALRASCPEVRDRAAVRAAYDSARFAYGPAFDVIEEARSGDGGALLTLTLPEADGVSLLPPALLDGALRACHWADRPSPEESGSLAVPFNLGALEIRAPRGLPRRCHAHAVPAGPAGDASGLRRFDVRILDDAGAELVRVDGFGGRHLAREDAPFFYEQVWEDQDLVAGAAPGADAVLVLGDDDEVARGLAGPAGGRRVIDVRVAREFARTGPGRYAVDPTRPGDFERLIADLARDGVRSLDVVHLWGLTAEPVDYGRAGASADAQAALDGAFARGLRSLRSLALALDAVRLPGRVRCAYVLDGTEHGPRPEQEAVAGFALSLAGVLPRCELFTVARADGPELPAVLDAELARAGRLTGAEIRHSAAGRQVRVLRRAEASGTGAAVPLKRGGTYLITGGTGGIGLELARHLASTYRARLVLVSRSADRPAAREAADGLVALGGEVLLAAADTADAAGMRAAVARAKERFGHLDGVFHLAGAADQCSLLEADAARFTELLSVKAHGVRLLDALTADEPLDLFVVFSSIASVVGDFGACAYAAANRFLDSYAELRDARVREGRASGRTLSLAWPLWRIGGVDALMGEQERAGYRHRTGMREFTGEEGLRALELALRTGRVRLVPAVGDPATVDAALSPRAPGTPPHTTTPPHTMTPPHTTVGTPPHTTPPHTTASAAAPAAAPTAVPPPATPVPALLDRMRDHVRALLGQVLGLAAERIDDHTALDAYGLDSVLVMETNEHLDRDFPGARGTLLFEYRTVHDLAAHLLDEHPDAARRLFPDEAAPRTPPVTVEERPAAPAAPAPPRREPAGDDDIAIIGIGGRYPHARDLTEFWENLRRGHDAVTEVPRDRWDAEAHFADDHATPGASYGKWGGFLADVDAFDSLFFRIPPSQAKLMDPQERLFLEAAWSALENAGYPPSRLPRPRFGGQGRDVGVFAGVMWGDYAQLAAEESARGNHHTVLANRSAIANQVSYFGDFRGPSVVVDTACSASLVALHQACESVRRGECRYAVAGGVNVSAHPSKYAHLSRMRMLSTDGRCRSFGAGGDGYVPGEGVGAVLLKRLSEAVADGDHIHAVIKATAVNHGGRTGGYTVPNPQAQQALVEEALHRAGIDPGTIGYVEAHGTGTALGDPIEHTALQQAFAGATRKPGAIALGSVKSNIGHLEGAAGIAGVTKAVLQLAHGQLAPSLHSEETNPIIDFARSPFRVQRTLADWARPVTEVAGVRVEQPRRASVSSFGAGGTNAHVILEEYRAPEERPAAPSGGSELLVLSARNPERLRAYAAEMAAHLRRERPALVDVGHTLRVGREALPERLAFPAADIDDAADTFAAFADGESVPSAITGNAEGHTALADVFTDGAGPDFLRTLAAAGDHARLARLWVSGAFAEWTALEEFAAGGRRTLPLPGYPFERPRHWLPVTRTEPTEAPRPPARTPARPAQPRTAVTTLSLAPTDPVVRDHVVGGRAVLPGVGHLDLVARGLGADAARGFRDVRWLSPLTVPDTGTEVLLTTEPDATSALGYRLSAPPTDEGPTGEGPVFSLGQVLASLPDRPEPLPIDLLKADCPREVGHEELYAGLRGQGLPYGPHFRRVTRAWTGEGTVLARLSRPREDSGAAPGPLDPGTLDAALHPLALLLADSGASARPLLPFAADRVEIHAALPDEGWSHVRDLGSRRFDVTVTDTGGRVCVRVVGLALRELKPEPSIDYRPRWAVAPPAAADTAAPRTVLTVTGEEGAPQADILREAHPDAGHVRLTIGEGGLDERAAEELLTRVPDIDLVYFLDAAGTDGPVDDRAGLHAAQDRGAVSLHRLIRGLDRAGVLDRPLSLKVLTADGLPLGDDDAVRPTAAGLIGYCEVAAKEFPRLSAACLDVRGGELDAGVAALVEEPALAKVRAVSLRGGVRRVRRLEAVQTPAAPTRFRERGVYLIIGGLGVLGRDTARHLARTYRARLVLVGRGALDERRRADLAELQEPGAEVSYVRCDAGDPVALRQVIDETKDRFGALHGVIHSAMVLVDKPVRDLSEAELRTALDAKADTVWSMFHALRGERPDFVLLYSSAVTLEGNHGQAGYAAGCHVADAWAHAAARTAPYPVRTVNWGYWHAAGDAHRERVLSRFAAAGIRPIGAEEGMAAVERVLSGALPQMLVVQADPKILAGLGVDPDTVLRAQPERPAPPALMPSGGREPLVRSTRGGASTETEAFARRLLVGALRTMGVLRGPGERHTRDGLRTRLGVVAAQERLLGLLLDILLRGGHLRAEGVELVTTPLVDDPELLRCAARPQDAAEELTARHPEAGPVSALLLRCVEALPGILTGRRGHMDVLFPGGSFDLVEAVYAGDPVTDRCNEQVAGTVVRYVRERLRGRPGDRVKVLEVGAGTGGTSARVLRAIAEAGLGDHVEYLYTDVSEGFVRHGRKRFGADHPFAGFRALDIERDPGEQGVESGGYDLVLGANVFHATAGIDRTLAHTKRLLATNGVLVLNEGVEQRDQMSLIFGLATGWWLFEDAEYRLPHSPLLSVAAWRDVLAQHGFRRITEGPRPDGGTYQCVLVAESDGFVPVSAPAAPALAASRPVVTAPAARPAETDRVGAAERRVTAVFARVLEMPEDLLDPRATFENYGVDSLVVLSLTKELEQEYGPLPSTLLFEHITIERLARHLATTGAGATPEPVIATEPEPVTEPAEPEPDPGIEQIVDSLSDAEVDRLLRQLSHVLQDQEEQR